MQTARERAPVGIEPGIQHHALFWIPGSLAQHKIDYVNFALSERPRMTMTSKFPVPLRVDQAIDPLRRG